ncbi:RES domain-containing protein [Dyella sp. M7H15-1]|uniref:RES family NAD+ phosphorylase n=1 Tax=Dyella sp. M7H15-1 TaxID=2501295 RepID=UPI00100515C7|nr:RES family NAD+ phosphorylase [Dyella sp. M7H15-1]QAU24821.1 RES domain-containing protein [Dyella sp. M7H15-1]
MTITAWRIGTDTPDYTAEDKSGTGAKMSGGRWNRPGNHMLYTATSVALACLETLVHLKVGSLPLNRYLVRLDIPNPVWSAAEHVDPSNLAMVGWDAEPAGAVSLNTGDAWLAANSSAILRVPSVIVPEECNVLINPKHPDATSISAIKLRKFVYDRRFRA